MVNPWHSVYPRRKELSAATLREALNSQNYLPFEPLIQGAVVSVHLNEKVLTRLELKFTLREVKVRAISEAVSGRPFTTLVRIPTPVPVEYVVDKIFSEYSGFPCRYHSTSASYSYFILLPQAPYNHSDCQCLFLPLQKGCGPQCSKHNISGLVYVALVSLFKNNEM